MTPTFGAPQPSSPATATSASPLALGPLTVPTARLRREGERWQVELGEGESLRLIQIPAGEFAMGSPADESPQHPVRLGGGRWRW